MTPGQNMATFIERASKVIDHWRPFGIPAMLVMSHPLDTHGLADFTGNQRGISGRIFMSIAPVAPGTFDIDQANLFFWKRYHRGDLVSSQMGRLGGRPKRQ